MSFNDKEYSYMIDRFSDRIDKLESLTREITVEVTTNTFLKGLSTDLIQDKTIKKINLLTKLFEEINEYLYILAPERIPTIKSQADSIYMRLKKIEDTFNSKNLEMENLQSTIDEFKTVFSKTTEFIELCNEVKNKPSPLITAILSIKEGRLSEASPETWAKLERIGRLVEDIRASYDEITEKISYVQEKVETIEAEYRSLMLTFDEKRAKVKV